MTYLDQRNLTKSIVELFVIRKLNVQLKIYFFDYQPKQML